MEHLSDKELRILVDALALQAVGWNTEVQQKQRNDAWQTVANRVQFLRKENEIAFLEEKLAKLKQKNN
jgi:hypothetical protein